MRSKRSAAVPQKLSAPEQLLTEVEVAHLLQLKPRALQAWRVRGGGPAFIRISGRAIRYRRSDLEQWILEHRRESTSDPGMDER